MRAITALHIAVFVFGFVAGAVGMTAETNAVRDAFEKRCGGCHGVDTSKEGPALRGVVGRRAGRQPSFPYSDALKAAAFDWDAATLDRWLTDPDRVAPGTDMAFRLENKEERARIIAYLEQLK